jgi:hypothetical protein
MSSRMPWLWTTLGILLASGAAMAAPDPPLAFPGARGFGAHATGGRGGDVYAVTSLSDSGPGSLRHGLETSSGPRTIVFRTGGTIDLESPLVAKAAHVTIAGQTAPGGIGLRGYPSVVANTHDVVIRYVRFRTGDVNARGVPGKPGRGNADLSGDAADALSVVNSERVMIDHVSTSWSMDETLSVTRSRDVTVQHSIIAESLNDSFHPEGPHGYGSLLRTELGGYSFLANLYAHHLLRNPAVGGDEEPVPGQPRGGLDMEFVNNVVYDWGILLMHTLRSTGRLRVNYVGNVLLAGPSTFCPTCAFAYIDASPEDKVSLFHEGNWIDSDRNGIFEPAPASDANFGGAPFERVDEPFDFASEPGRVLEGHEAFRRVLREAGASRARDAVDLRLVRQVLEQTGSIIDSQDDVGGWPADLAPGPAPPDGDGDGMPDPWECENGLDPTDADDGNRFDRSRRYTNLEVYLHSAAGGQTHLAELDPRPGRTRLPVSRPCRSEAGGP